MPQGKRYDGSTDPEDHIAEYNTRMVTCNIPEDTYKTIVSKAFSSTLTGSARRWFSSLPLNSIDSFAELMTKFVSHFSHNKKPEVEEEDLYEHYQKRNETLRKYLKQFNDTKVSIPNCHEKAVVSTFIKGLVKDTRVHIELTRRKPKIFFELSNKF